MYSDISYSIHNLLGIYIKIPSKIFVLLIKYKFNFSELIKPRLEFIWRFLMLLSRLSIAYYQVVTVPELIKLDS